MLDRFTRLYISAKTLVQPEDGQATTEYALVLALLVAACAVAVGILTGSMQGWFTSITGKITQSLPS